MKEEKIFEIIADINEKYIAEAKIKPKKKKKQVWIKWIAAAACLCLILVGVWNINKNFKNSNVQNPAITDTALYIPAVKLPDTTAGMQQKMEPLVVYNGCIYTLTEDYYGSEALKIDSLIGEYLGYATGSIDEWSTQEEYSEEFASTMRGKVYEVIGYDTDFRICIRRDIEDDDGGKPEDQLRITFFERLNDITLRTGADLFENRLHIRNQIANIQWQSCDDRFYRKENIQNATLDSNLLEKFFDQINKNMFINLASPNKSIYDTPRRTHIYLTMKDGTVVRLCLIEGGYVGYDGLAYCFVQIPEEIFNEVFTACGGTYE